MPASPLRTLRVLSISITIALGAAPAWALYQVVDAQGRVTYTDRPPSGNGVERAAVMRPAAASAAAAEAATWPYALREPVRRYPVILYTTADCPPCEAARRLLQQRGIPYTEKTVATEDDARAFDQLGAGRMVPGLGVGSRQLRGLDEAQWMSYLDAAGYPATSVLPRGWKPADATSLAPTGQTATNSPPNVTATPREATAPRTRPRPAAEPAPAAATLRF